ncbi:MAG TPA: imidazoleglycerol-phosphate dehydratase HisB, partial [Phenylobacterium sp.]|nr:imidazoleglycerol-phosphate dehydratase HisB [Phenylobacterium sp.]
GDSTVSTGIGFFDHMLESFFRHGGFDGVVETKGDLHIDMHHTVEDTGIVLGQAFAKALDGFKGIRRFGSAYIPMDETLTRCALDLSNRAYLIHKVDYKTPKVGDMDTELFKEFHHAFAMNCGACVHLETLYGVNSHHIAESGFKALARSLRHAVELDPKTHGKAPSTKGVL